MTREEATEKAEIAWRSEPTYGGAFVAILAVLDLIKFDQPKSAKDKLLDAWPQHWMGPHEALEFIGSLNLEIVEKK